MLALRSPHEAYRRVDFDARVAGADQRELAALCFETLNASIGTAIGAAARGDNTLKSRSLTRGLSAVLALRMGVAGDTPVADALRTFYDGARRTLLDAAISFDAERLSALRADVADVASALGGAR